jgi:hypothetical protein
MFRLSMRQRVLTIVGAVAAALVMAPVAHAGTVSLRPQTTTGRETSFAYSLVSFEAATGETNAVTMTQDANAVVVHDSGADVVPGDHCVALDPRTARCDALPDTQLEVDRVRLGDGDDAWSGDADTVDGGPGADVLSGGIRLVGATGDDTLIGDSRPNELEGGDGRDRLYGGAGDDALRGDGGKPASDVLDGGEGRDSASWSGHRVPVSVDLADPGPDGAAGEGDALNGIENLTGGRAGDRLAGDGGKNALSGGPGDDVLVGRAGPDELDGGHGDNRLIGGAGNDVLDSTGKHDVVSAGPGRDFISLNLGGARAPDSVVDCGAGRDDVLFPRGTDLLRADCETIALGSYDYRRRSPESRSALVFKLMQSLSDEALRPTCLRFTIGAHRALGGAEIQAPRRPGPFVRVRVPLTPAGRRVAARPGRTVVPLRLVEYTGRCGARTPDQYDFHGSYRFEL